MKTTISKVWKNHDEKTFISHENHSFFFFLHNLILVNDHNNEYLSYRSKFNNENLGSKSIKYELLS